MNIAKTSVSQPVLINLIMALVIVGGAMSYSRMAREIFPEVSIDAIMITTVMQGASPKEMEQLVTIPLEEEIGKIDGIDEMTSVSSDGRSSIFVELEPDVESVFEKITEVQNQIELVENFPDEAEQPVVTELAVTFELITVSLVGEAPELETKKFVDELESRLKVIKGVEEVDVAGVREREIRVEVDPFRLRSYNLSLSDVAEALRRRNLNLPGGPIRMGRAEFNVRTEAEYDNLEEVLDTILIDDGQGSFVYARDVAEVTNAFEDRTSLARLDGRPAVNLIIKKDKTSNAMRVVEKVRETVEELRPQLPAGLSIRYVDDTSIDIRERLKSLYLNFALGLVLVVISFTVFIGLRAGLMVALGLPVALLGTFVFLHWYGYSVNLLVLFSLILVLGLVVDDAIVVCENIYRYLEEGMSLKEAAVKGTEEITWPVIATVLTTIAAFLPLLIMKGVLGKFMGIIPVVVTAALIASMFECFFILPGHVAEFGGNKNNRRPHEPRLWISRLIAMYKAAITQLLRLRYLVVVATVGAAALAGYVAYAHMDFVLFGGNNLYRFQLEVEAPSGASLEETARILKELEKRAMPVKRDTPDLEHIKSRVGFISRGTIGGISGTNVGSLSFEMKARGRLEKTGHEVKDEVRRAVAGVTGARAMTFEDARDGPPVGKAIQVRIKGDNFETLKKISGEVQEYLRTIEGVKDIMDNFPPGKDEVRPNIDLERAAALGLDVRTIATEIRGAFDGLEATTVHDGNDEIDVVVRYDERYRRSLSDLAEMKFATPAGMVPLRNFAEVERAPGFAQIGHHDQDRTINVLADVDEDVITSTEANLMLMKRFESIGERFPGYSMDFGGEFEDTRESLVSLFQAFFITLILIYVILGGLFKSFVQPFIVMSAVPFSFVGVVVGFYIMNEPLGMFSIVGIIGLAGIVVNDSLILIDFINTSRRGGAGLRESIVESGAVRLRPIILTSITTIFGLLPMTLGLFGVDPLMQPMARAIVWGLTFSTVLTLVVIPCIYLIFDDFATRVLNHPLGLTREEWRQRQEGSADELSEAPPLSPEPEPAES